MHRLARTPAQRAELVDARDHAPDPTSASGPPPCCRSPTGMPAAPGARSRAAAPPAARHALPLAGALPRRGRGGAAPPAGARAPARVSPPLPRRRPRPGRPGGTSSGVTRARWASRAAAGGWPTWWPPAPGCACGITARPGPRLARLGIGDKRGRDYLHRPDPADAAKREAIARAQAAAAAAPERVALLWLGELTVDRQPTLARAWAGRGRAPAVGPPLHPRRHPDPPHRRLGRPHRPPARQARQPDQRGDAGRLPSPAAGGLPRRRATYVVLDTWPLHFPPDVLAALEPQEPPWPARCPPSWPADPSAKAVARWGKLRLPIQRLAAAHLRLLVQPDREGLAQAARRAGPPPPVGRRPDPAAEGAGRLAGPPRPPAPDLLRDVGLDNP